jgi:hypothetical protein
MRYTSQSALPNVVRSAVVVFGLIILLGLIPGLYYVKTRASQLAIVCTALSVFDIALASITTARNVELVPAMAA